jgi:hypothetical protein
VTDDVTTPSPGNASTESVPATTKETTMTLGESRVRITFNPSDDSLVSQIKQKSAELIDLCETIKSRDPRLVALAQTHYEDAAMWAVKAATADPK